MKIVHNGFIYESTLLEMPARVPSLNSGVHTDERELKGMNDSYDPMRQNVVFEKKIGDFDYYILEEKGYKNSGMLYVLKGSGFIGHIDFTSFKKDSMYPNGILIDYSYLLSPYRGSGIMVDAYRILINHYGLIVSDKDLTPESYGVYAKLSKEYDPMIFDGEMVFGFDFTDRDKLKAQGMLNKEHIRYVLGKKAGTGLLESLNGRTLISVDIQPDYEKAFGFKIHEFTNWLEGVAGQYNNIIFLFNGPDLGFPSQEEYIHWLYENEVSEELLNRIMFFDKGYAFFRNAIDAGLDENEIVKLIQYMMKNKINDSRDIEEEVWEQIGLDDSLIDHMKDNEDALFIPEVLSFLSKINGQIDLVGGGVNECLKEVELCLHALNKPFNLIDEWTY